MVVVVLPFVPLITTTPYGKDARVRDIKFLSIFSTKSPGRADPPPRAWAMARTVLPVIVVNVCRITVYYTSECRDRETFFNHLSEVQYKLCLSWACFLGGIVLAGNGAF